MHMNHLFLRLITCLRMVPLFRECPVRLLNKLSLHAEVMILPPQTYIQNVNVMSHNLYIISRGFCQMCSMLPGDFENKRKITLRRGDLIAPIETLHRLKMFGSIVSITAVELISISYEAFIDNVQSNRTEFTFLKNALAKHMKQFESILMRKGCRLPPLKSVMPSLGKVDTFTYKIFENELSTDDEYIKPFNKLGNTFFT